MNLAVADVTRLSTAIGRWLNEKNEDLLDRYSDDALRRVWQSTHFSWWMTSMLHTLPATEPDSNFLRQMQVTQLRHVTSSGSAAANLAENYTGLPL